MGERQKVGAVTQTGRNLSGAWVALETVAIVLMLGLLAFAPLGAQQLERVKKRMEVGPLRAGEALFRQGDPGDRLYVLTQGSISIVGGNGPVRQRFESFSPGVMMGDMSMLDGVGRSADAIADNEVVVWSLTRATYEALVLDDPLLGERLTRNIAIHLSERLRGPG